MFKKRLMTIFSLLIFALAALPVLSRASEPPSISTSNTNITAGQRVEFTGSNFWAGEKVVNWATGPDQSVANGNTFANAAKDGSVAFSFDLPRDALSGTWAVTAYGVDSKTPAVTYFEVSGRDPGTVQPVAAVEPTAGPAGTQFAFAAIGYKPKERISYWVTAPGGEVYAAYPDAAESKNGRVDIGWRAPVDAAKGTWVMTIQGLKSGTARAIPFEIQ
jgi:hypothetical protein